MIAAVFVPAFGGGGSGKRAAVAMAYYIDYPGTGIGDGDICGNGCGGRH